MRSEARGLLAALLTLGILHPAAGAESEPNKDRDAPDPPKLVLEAQPRIGFSPLQLTLRATLNGVSRDDYNFCHVERVWLGKRSSDSSGRERASVNRPRCHHPDDERHVELRFYKDLTLYSPGAYTYRFKVKPKKGSPIYSNPVTLQVLNR